jgi:hypothetical protein
MEGVSRESIVRSRDSGVGSLEPRGQGNTEDHGEFCEEALRQSKSIVWSR